MQQIQRFTWLSAGRRWRKTTLGVSLAVQKALQGRKVGWGAPTHDQVRIAWDEMYKAAGGTANFRIVRGEVVFPTGGKVFFRSLDDPDNARGHTADDWIFDEVADIRATAYYDIVFPMLIENIDSTFLGMGTPKGRNWFWREHASAAGRDASISFQVPTVGCKIVDGALVRVPHLLENPDVPFAEIERMFQTTPASTFRQEILAEFLEGEGQVFRNIPACMHALAAVPKDHEGHKIVAGVDWGKQADFTAISIGCADCRTEIAKDRFNQIDYVFQRGRLKALYDTWFVRGALPERNSVGVPNIEQLMREGFHILAGPDGKPGFETTATTKPPLIENLALALERAEWQFLDDPLWTAELEAYERKVSPSTGRSSYGAPEGMHDDTVIARALMLRAATGHHGIWT